MSFYHFYELIHERTMVFLTMFSFMFSMVFLDLPMLFPRAFGLEDAKHGGQVAAAHLLRDAISSDTVG